jgi:FtsH-binding integral membrane protein
MTATIVALAVQIEDSQEWMMNHTWIFWVSLVLDMVIICSLSCCENLARKVPTNYILLLVFTLCQSYMVSFTCTCYTKESVVVAAVGTAALVGGLTAYAFCAKTD